jgi:hypothetical protein
MKILPLYLSYTISKVIIILYTTKEEHKCSQIINFMKEKNFLQSYKKHFKVLKMYVI